MPTIRTGDIDTYYESEGEGPPIVFIHGMMMTATMWAPQADVLSDAYTTVAYDVRGHGRTGGSDRDVYTIALFAEDLAALLDALGIDRAVICGLSMGGAVAQAFAVAYPERLAGLVLADAFPAGPMPLFGRLAMANIRFLARLARFVDYRTLNRIQLRVGNWLLPGISGDEITVQRLLEEAPTIPQAEFEKIADATARFPRSELDGAAVTVPTLVLAGEHYPLAYEGMKERLAAQFPNADTDISVVPRGGHASNLDNPASFNAAVTELLRRADWDGPGRSDLPRGFGD